MKTRIQTKFLCGVVMAALSALPIAAHAQGLNSNARRIGHVEKATKLVGDSVQDTSNHKLGDIQDIVVALESGRVLYAVVSTGGFLGIGDHLTAIPPGAFTEKNNHLEVNIDKQKLAGAPEFKNNDSDVGSLAFVESVHQYFGQKGWWEGPSTGNSAGRNFHNVHKVSALKGMDVDNVSNQKIADVNNVLVDLPAGRVVYVVIAPDKNMNLGDNLYALPPNALTLSADKKSLITGVTREQLASAPHFSKDNWPDLSNPSLASQIYRHYGKQAYFENGLQPTSGRDVNRERIYHEPNKLNK